MPEGHSVHRIARQFAQNFVGQPRRGVLAAGPLRRRVPRCSTARTMIDAKAVGKQMFLEFDDGLWLRVHLGMYGAWDFAGEITRRDHRIRGTRARWARRTSAGPSSTPTARTRCTASAPRGGRRVRMAEQEKPEDDDRRRSRPSPSARCACAC